MTKIEIKITGEAIDITHCINQVMLEQCGGIDVFIGTVRNQTKGKKVIKLEFEAYEPMAIRELENIATAACAMWSLHGVVIHHRTGTLFVGEVPVIIAVSAAHRAAAFDACRYIIDTLKQTVPIWKKEFFEGGEVWVGATP